jgi:gliding motility-associated-like protein
MRARKLLLAIFVLFSSLIKPISSSAQSAGGELIYRWMGDSTYRFFFKLYRDCNGIAPPNTVQMCATNVCNQALNFNPTLFLWPGAINGSQPNGTPLGASCPGVPTKCQSLSSPYNNYEEWWYSADVTLPMSCINWKFSVQMTPRMQTNNLVNGNTHIEVMFNNKDFQGNSSPFYSVRPVPNICLNKPYAFNNGATDDNKDSLSTEVINPLTGANCLVSQANSFKSGSPSYSIPGNPLQTGNSFSIDPASGNMTYTPTLTGPSAIMVRTREYRNGVLIGSITREFVVTTVNNCNINTVPPVLTIKNVAAGIYSNGSIYTCKEFQLSFCFDIVSPNSSAIMNVSSNANFSVPSSGLVYTNQNTDSVRGCFSFNSSQNDSGQRNLVITVVDSTCAAPGMVHYYSYTIPIIIWGRTRALTYTEICPGNAATLTAINGTNFQWVALPGGSGTSSLSCAGCKTTLATPSVTTTYQVTATNNVCPTVTDTVTVKVNDVPIFTPIADIIACPHTPVQLNLNPQPPIGATYRYKWLPGSFLNNDTISNPLSTTNGDIKYTVTITTNNNCKAYDTLAIDVLDGFTIYNNDSTLCVGQTMQIKAKGDSRYTYLWTTTSPNSNINTITQLQPAIQQSVRDKYYYKITASYPGCADSTDSLAITAQPYPEIQIDPDLRICHWDSAQLKATISPADFTYTYKWIPATDLSDPNIPDPFYYGNTIGSGVYKLIATSSAACADTAEVNIKVSSPTEFLKLLSTDTTICSPDSIQLHVMGDGLSKVTWHPGVSLTDTASFEPYAFPGAATTYYVIGVDSNGCRDSLGLHIKVKPAGVVFLPDTVKIYPGESYRMDPQGNCLYFSWNTYLYMDRGGVADPLITPESNIQYIAHGRTEFGCIGTDTVDVILMENSIIAVPNAFTPGIDRLNPMIKTAYRGRVQLKSFTIFNRWGNKVFETKNLYEGWDGKFNGELQPLGVYIYYIDAILDKDTKVQKQGNITLIR